MRRASRTRSSSTTDPRQFVTPAEQAALAAVSEGARFLRYGGDCYCYTQLAMGLVDVVIENGLQPYDVQALIPLIEAAGGRDHQLAGRALRPGRAGARLRRPVAARRHSSSGCEQADA